MKSKTNSLAVNREINSIECESSIEAKRSKDLTTIVTIGLFLAGFVLIYGLCAFNVIKLPAGF